MSEWVDTIKQNNKTQTLKYYIFFSLSSFRLLHFLSRVVVQNHLRENDK